MSAAYQSFGRIVAGRRAAIDADAAVALLESGRAAPQSLLGVGNLRSYGDSCHNDAGTLADMRADGRILSFDAETGVMEAEAGAMLGDIIRAAAPHGFFPPVVPGTQYVTLGGAIANDVHGKNHHRKGTFGRHVEEIVLLRSNGRTCRCAPDENQALFAATIGGMGLSGLILSARIRLMPVAGLDVEETVTAFGNLEGYFDLAEEADAQNEYAVAWLDQLAEGAAAGRGLLIAGNHVAGRRDAGRGRQLLSVPVQPPFGVLARPSLKLFNTLYYRRKGRSAGPRRSDFRSFFFPLDGVAHWNRLYGPRGLYQHQSVVPHDTARQAVPALLAAAREAGQASFLTVLKRFGDVTSPGLLSFPRPGYTLTLDFPNRGRRTLDLLDVLDRITVEAGGAVNAYKDARMSAAVFAASYPAWNVLETLRDPAFMSDFWRRTAMRLETAQAHAAEAAE